MGFQMLKGVVESDKTFFKKSLKGRKTLGRKPKKRGRKDKKRGISNLNFVQDKLELNRPSLEGEYHESE